MNAIRDSGSLQITKSGELIVTEELEQALRGVPDSVTGLLTSKVDKLTPSQQTILKIAAIIGQTFTFKTLAALLPDENSRANLKKDLGFLTRGGMVVLETPDPNSSYSFVNTILRDVVYDLMLFSQRKHIHKAIVDIYKTDFQGMTTYYPILGYHCKQAELDEEANQHFTKAGSTCLFNYANKEATTFFSEAIHLTEKLKRMASIEGISLERKLGQGNLWC